MKKKLPYILILLLIILQAFSIFRINTLSHELGSIRNSLTGISAQLNNSMNGIRSEVYQALSQQAGILDSAEYTIGDFDTDSLTVPISFTVQPRELKEGTALFLKFSDRTMPMEKDGTEFKLTEEFKLDEDILPTVIIENDGVQQFESPDTLRVYSLVSQLFPEAYPQFSGSRGHLSHAPYNFDIDGHLSFGIVSYSPDCRMVSGRYAVTIDGEEVESIEGDFSDPGLVPDIEVKGKYPLSDGQVLEGRVEMEDSSGFRYEYLLFRYTAGVDIEDEAFFESCRILTPDGKTAYDYNT